MKLEVEVKVSSRRGERLLSTHVNAGHRVVYVDAHTYRCDDCSHTLLVEHGRSRHEDTATTSSATDGETEGQRRLRILRDRRAAALSAAASPESQAVWLARIRADLAARKGARR